jgi:hypothetical protein
VVRGPKGETARFDRMDDILIQRFTRDEGQQFAAGDWMT